MIKLHWYSEKEIKERSSSHAYYLRRHWNVQPGPIDVLEFPLYILSVFGDLEVWRTLLKL